MRRLWLRVNRMDVARVSAILVAATVVAVLAAFGLGAYTAPPTVAELPAAGALLVVAGTGLLYAWRLGAGGLSD